MEKEYYGRRFGWEGRRELSEMEILQAALIT
jgi:hypothetical protein